MKIKVSKVFAKYLNSIKDELRIDHAEVVTMNKSEYSFRVSSDVLEAYDCGDVDYDDDGNDVFKVIVVVYPDNYYACNRYITTAELNKEFRRMHVKDEDGLKTMLKQMIEI